jgi:Flp pilus assembly protein TadG
MNLRQVIRERRGAVAPLTALLLIPLVGMLAFAIDLGYVVQTDMELQNAADAAALAAAEQLPPYYVQYYQSGADQATVLSGAKTKARSFASKYASFHRAGNATSVALDTTNDVVFGYQDANTAFTTSPPSGSFPNTVQVTLRLDGGGSTNPKLGLFFGPSAGVPAGTNQARRSSGNPHTGSRRFGGFLREGEPEAVYRGGVLRGWEFSRKAGMRPPRTGLTRGQKGHRGARRSAQPPGLARPPQPRGFTSDAPVPRAPFRVPPPAPARRPRWRGRSSMPAAGEGGDDSDARKLPPRELDLDGDECGGGSGLQKCPVCRLSISRCYPPLSST